MRDFNGMSWAFLGCCCMNLQILVLLLAGDSNSGFPSDSLERLLHFPVVSAKKTLTSSVRCGVLLYSYTRNTQLIIYKLAAGQTLSSCMTWPLTVKQALQ